MEQFNAYTDRTWYSTMSGEYVVVEPSDKDSGIALRRPWEDEQYFHFGQQPDQSAVLQELKEDLRPVPSHAVRNPGDFLSEILDLVEAGESLSLQAQRGLGYIRAHPELPLGE